MFMMVSLSNGKLDKGILKSETNDGIQIMKIDLLLQQCIEHNPHYLVERTYKKQKAHPGKKEIS